MSSSAIDFSKYTAAPTIDFSSYAQSQDPDKETPSSTTSAADRIKKFLGVPTSQEITQQYGTSDISKLDASKIPTNPGAANQALRDAKAGNYTEAAHDIISAEGKGFAPLAIPALFSAPLATGLGFVGGFIGQRAGSGAARALGASQGTQDLAGDIGSFAGGLAGYKSAGGLKYVAGKPITLTGEQASAVRPAASLQPALNNTPEEVLRYAQSRGIDLTPGQAMQTPLARTGEAIGERSLGGANSLFQAKELNATKLLQNVAGIADRADPHALGETESDMGSTLQQTAKVAQSIAHDNASQAYKGLPEDLQNTPINVSAIRSKYFQILKASQTALANRNPQIAAQIGEFLQRAANLGTPDINAAGAPFQRPELTFSDLAKLRSDAIADGGAMSRAGAPSEVEGLYRQLAGDIDSAMESAAGKAGYLKEWRAANAGWKDYLSKYGDPASPIYQALNQKNPELAARSILNRASANDVRFLQQENMTPALEAMRRQVITRIANSGFRLGAKGLGGFSDDFLQSLFGPDGAKELYINADLARRMNFQMNPSGTSNVLLGMEQLSPKEPSRFMIPMGLAKASMPRPANSYLPKVNVPPEMNPAITVGGLIALRSLLGNQDKQ